MVSSLIVRVEKPLAVISELATHAERFVRQKEFQDRFHLHRFDDGYSITDLNNEEGENSNYQAVLDFVQRQVNEHKPLLCFDEGDGVIEVEFDAEWIIRLVPAGQTSNECPYAAHVVEVGPTSKAEHFIPGAQELLWVFKEYPSLHNALRYLETQAEESQEGEQGHAGPAKPVSSFMMASSSAFASRPR